jgi:hypothetical protein
MVDGNQPIMCGILGLIRIGIQPTNGMCRRINIRIRKAYFYGKHVDFVWYGKKGIRRRIKKGLWIIHLDLKDYDFKLDVTRRVLLGKKCV